MNSMRLLMAVRSLVPVMAVVAWSGVVAVQPAATAADIVKANNLDALNVTTSWEGGVVPGSGDRAIWDATVTSANTVNLGANTTWGGLWVQNPGGAVTIQGANTLSAGPVTIDASATLALANSTSTLNFTGLAGAGTLEISKGASSSNISAMTAAGSLDFNGTLRLRGGSATTSTGSVAGNWLMLGGSGVSQAAGTAFALDTGASTSDAKDLIFTDVWNEQTVNLSSLTGFGSIRRDSGNSNNVTLRVEQSTNTTFNGLILSHTSGTGAIRSIDFVKAGSGTLTLAGLVGKQTASAGGANSPVNIEVAGGTLVMTASNTTTGNLTVRSGGLLRMENGSAGTGFTGGNASMTGSYTIDAGGEIQAFRNGAAAFGTGAIVMDGGSLFQTSGNWTWTNAITLNASTASVIGNKGTGSGRWLKLQGAISGSGNVTFSDPGSAVTSGDTGIILTGANTMAGTVSIDTFVRVGGVTGDSTSLTAGTGGSLGTAAVTINSGRRLTFSRSDTHTVANAISGAGVVHVGGTGITGSNTQDVTLSGTNSYSGGTELLQGTLRVAALSGIGSGYLAVKNGATFVYTGASSETTTRNLFLDLGPSRIDVTQVTGSLTWNDAAAKNNAFTKGGAGSLTIGGVFSGGASVTVLDGRLTLAGSNTYTGTTTVSGGTLLVNGSLAADSAVTVQAAGTLGGSGTIGGATTIFGTHSPGTSPGVQTFGGNLSYDGATVIWELTGNTATQTTPTAVFDQVIVGGNLDFTSATSLSLVFDDPASSVNWTNPFWDLDREWLLYDVTGTTSNFSNFSISTQSWLDGFGNVFATERPQASFGLRQDVGSGDVFLTYAAVPEPGGLALAAAGLALAGWQVSRWRR
jgi:fibronectin-binding autotransporter adhesin